MIRVRMCMGTHLLSKSLNLSTAHTYTHTLSNTHTHTHSQSLGPSYKAQDAGWPATSIPPTFLGSEETNSTLPGPSPHTIDPCSMA